MLMHKKSIRSRSKRTRRKQSKFITPDLALFHRQKLQFVAGPDDPLREAERVCREFAEMVEEQHAAVSQFLQRAYGVAAQFRRRPRDFERFQVHSFWKQTGQTPKGPSTSKWVLLFLMQATTTPMRHRASKYAVILDGLNQDQVEIGAVAARIQKLGGVGAAYEAMRARKRAIAQVSGTGAAAETTAVAGRRTCRDDESSSCKIRESVMPTKPIRSWPKRTLEGVEAAHEAVHGLPTMIGEEGAFDFVQRLAQEYAQKNEGHYHKTVTNFLQRAYLAALGIKNEPVEFERLKADPFWKAPWRRPKDGSTSKWVLYFIMGAATPNVRHLAGKYAVIIEGLMLDQVEVAAVAAHIKELGGIEAAYEAMRARMTGHESRVIPDSQNKKTSVLKSTQRARAITQAAKPNDGDGQLFFDAEGPRPGYYIIGRFGEKIRFNPPKPSRPPRKLNDLDLWSMRISQCKAKLPQSRTKEERDHLNKEIRVLEQLIQERRAKVLDRRLAARTKRRLGW
jgi:hypothetical protein